MGTPDMRSLTAFRFLAAAHVLLLHEMLDDLPWVGSWGTVMLERTAALSFFFLVGGMLLTYVYWDRAATKRERQSFLIGRFARLYPLYLVGLMVFLPISVGRWVVMGEAPWEMVRALVAQLLLLQAWFPSMPEPWYINRPAWTISSFVLFYIALPHVIGVLRRLRDWHIVALFGALLFVSQALVWVFEQHIGIAGRDLEVLHKFPPVRWPEFLMGQCLGALVVRGRHAHGWLQRWWPFPVAGGAALALFLWLPQPWDNYIHNGLLSPLFAVMLLASLHAPKAATWLWSKPLQKLGRTSFTFYILHLAVGNVLSGAFYAVTWIATGTGSTWRLSLHPGENFAFIALDLAVLIPLTFWVHAKVEDPARDHIKQWWRDRVDAKSQPSA